MRSNDILDLPAPRPCAVCGRPTTRYSRDLCAPFCGRERPRPVVPEHAGPTVTGGRRRWWRGGPR